jgi:hypothetical protein
MLHARPGDAVIVGAFARLPLSSELAVTAKVTPLAAIDGAPVKPTVGVALTSVVVCVSVADLYVGVAAQTAFAWHLPTPVITVTSAVTVVPFTLFVPTVHVAEEAVITGTAVSFVDDAVSVYVEPYTAEEGAPDRLTVGTCVDTTVVLSTIGTAGAQLLLPGWVMVTVQVPLALSMV